MPSSSSRPPAPPSALLPLRQPPRQLTVHQAAAGGVLVTRHWRQQVGGGRAWWLMCNQPCHLSPVRSRREGAGPRRQPGWLPGAGGPQGPAVGVRGARRGPPSRAAAATPHPARPALPASQLSLRLVFLRRRFLEPNGSLLPARGLQPPLRLVSGDGTPLQPQPPGRGAEGAPARAAAGGRQGHLAPRPASAAGAVAPCACGAAGPGRQLPLCTARETTSNENPREQAELTGRCAVPVATKHRGGSPTPGA